MSRILTAPRTTTTVRSPRVRWDAIGAVAYREWLVFRRVWRAPMFGSVVEPIVYLLAFGYGFGALVAEVGGIPYLDFMATGSAAISVLFTGMFPGLINGYFRREENHLYDGMMAAPITVPELVTGEAAWTGVRTALVAAITLTVAWIFGVSLQPTVLLAPVIGFVGGFGFACFGAAFGSRLRSTHQFDFVIAGIIVPMFVVAGTFFPLDDAPAWLRWPATINPLTHVTDLFRAAAFGTLSLADTARSVGIVLAFAVGAWWLASRWLHDALVD
jgi:lipooligosaccharide transport system permease protein